MSSLVSSAAVDTIEANVIDDDLIRKAIYVPPSMVDHAAAVAAVSGGAPGASGSLLQNDHGSGGKGGKEGTKNAQDIEYHDVVCLVFSFRNIQRIDNLVGFENITKLQLDNNVISKIENLGFLTQLTWLDLSFNNITKIEGLDTLTKLTDLSLFNNGISVLENLDTLTNLHVLSVGNNRLSTLDNLMYLRRFKHLRSINLAGNPVCKDPEYRSYVLAHIRNLKYLDYRLCDNAKLTAAREQYQDELLELEEKERIEDEQAEADKVKQERLQLIKEAHLYEIETMFEDMMRDDTEYARLSVLPCVKEPVEEYQEKVAHAYEDFNEFMLRQHTAKTEEAAMFQAALDDTRNEVEDKALERITRFSGIKKHVLQEFRASMMNEEPDPEKLSELKELNAQLVDELLDLEMEMVEQNEEIILEYERKMGDLNSATMEQVASYFNKMRDLENAYHESVTSEVLTMWEQSTKGGLDDLSDEVRSLLVDKDTLVNAVNGSHDIHLAKIDSREDDLCNKEQSGLEVLLAKIKADENARNRNRVAEVWALSQRHLAEIDECLIDDDLADG